MTKLIIAEKPNVARRIASSLGEAKEHKKGRAHYYSIDEKDILVASAVGHLFTLRQARPMDQYPFFDIKWMSPSSFDSKMGYLEHYINVLRDLAKRSEEVVNACDYDLEGSVIGYNAIVHACASDPSTATRMKFSTLTKEELISSFEKREGHLNFPMIDAGLTRHMLDWYWGMNTSKALSSSVKRKSGKYVALSAGRVQTPTLFFINEREKKIEAFEPTPYWILDIFFRKDGTEIKASYPRRITSKEEADSIHNETKGNDGTVADIEKNRRSIGAPIPFDLGLLQSEAWNNFKFLPKVTQEVAQTLYEDGYISYPRTSSQKLPSTLGFKKILESLRSNDKYSRDVDIVLGTPLKPKQGKKDDPAHPAIYPTGLKPGKLNKYQEKLYDLIVCRFLSLFMPDASIENIKTSIDVSGHRFVADGRRVVEQGWMRFYGKYSNSKETILPEMSLGESVKIDKHEKLKKMTNPPPRYNPASAIKEMETLGIGTKATRANIIDTLYIRGYVKGREIAITPLGRSLVETLEKYCGDIVSVELTNHFENEMEGILRSEKTMEQVLKEAKKQLREIFKDFKGREESIGKELLSALIDSQNENLGECPKCGAELRMVVSKSTNKRFVGCSNYPKCKTSYPLPQKGSVTFSEQRCEVCGSPMLRNKRGTVCINMECPAKAKKSNGT
ncbi:MAG: DNA topoisomerase I [Candidatus Methanofastidiosa archaeon]|nr:DNA topoisomerase I [Candidatus Methanofastidiosa archaeon]